METLKREHKFHVFYLDSLIFNVFFLYFLSVHEHCPSNILTFVIGRSSYIVMNFSPKYFIS